MLHSRPARPLWRVAVVAALAVASLVSTRPAVAEDFFTERYPAVFFHNMGGFGVHAYTDETLDHLARFDRIFSGNEFALPTAWVDDLHQRDGVHRRVVSYEFFPAVHFIFGKDNPQSHDQWRLDFVDDHLNETFTINPVVPGPPPDASPGRWAPGLPLYDYFINYGQGDADDFLIAQYHGKLADWGYDGIFFDLMGSYWTNIGEIEDPAQPGTPLNALAHYGTLGATRDDPLLDYDENGLAFVERLQNEAPGSLEVWGNQAHRSGSPTNPSPYYEVLAYDIDESTFTTWLNPNGWTNGVRVYLDDTWIEDASPVETRIVPYEVGAALVGAMLEQADQAETAHGNRTEPLILNYVRPYYEPYQDGYRAIVDREAIYYGYAAGKALGVITYAWDFFDTVSNLTGIPGAPVATGLPLQPFFRWSDDPIYFLDLGSPTGDAEERDLGDGRKVVLRYFDKGFVAINASTPAQDITLDLSSDPDLKGAADGVGGYRDHFAGTTIDTTRPVFDVPAAWYPLAGVSTHSARVYSYTDAVPAVPTASGLGVVALCMLLFGAGMSAASVRTRRGV